MNIFYTPDIKDKIYTLNETESKHCIRVLRLKDGDEISLIDGIGGFYTAEIIDANSKSCKVQVNTHVKETGKRDYYLHLAIAPTKNIDRFEFFLEKATEIGVDEITPIVCEFSERKIIKHERLNKILISAAKQSLNAYIPKLNPLITFSAFLKIDLKGDKFVAHCYDSKKNKLKDIMVKSSSQVILIGPEGDFSKKEVSQCLETGFNEISLGDSRLRTETAGVVACHSVAFLNY